MSMKRTLKVKTVAGELHIVTDNGGTISTGCKSKSEYLSKLDISDNGAVDTVLVEV